MTLGLRLDSEDVGGNEGGGGGDRISAPRKNDGAVDIFHTEREREEVSSVYPKESMRKQRPDINKGERDREREREMYINIQRRRQRIT